MRLSLFDNTATGHRPTSTSWSRTAGTFSLEDRDAPPAPVGQTAANRNSGVINETGTITNDMRQHPDAGESGLIAGRRERKLLAGACRRDGRRR